MKGTLFNIQRFSLYDGPGIRTTIFFKGCPLSCRWCHNPESINARPQLLRRPDLCIGCGRCSTVCLSPPCTGCMRCAEVCPSGAIELCGKSYTIEEALEAALEDRFFYGTDGGVTLSGGEPLLQAEFAAAAAQRLKEEGIRTAIDTSGFAPWEKFELILPYADLFLYDLKAFDEDLHRELTGVSNGLILENLQKLCDKNARIFIRIPVIPGVNDGELEAIADFIAPLPIENVELMAYHDTARDKYTALHRIYPLKDTPIPDRKTIEHWIARMASCGVTAHCTTLEGGTP